MLLSVHVAAGVAGLVVGAQVIWLSRERPLLDGRARIYYWAVAWVALTSAALVVLSWPRLWGSSTEPHVHLQCMDHESFLLADGIPFRFDIDCAGDTGVPARHRPFDAPSTPTVRRQTSTRAETQLQSSTDT